MFTYFTVLTNFATPLYLFIKIHRYVYQNSFDKFSINYFIYDICFQLKLVNEWDMYGDNKMMFCFEFPLIIEPGSTSGDINDEKPAEYRIKPQT